MSAEMRRYGRTFESVSPRAVLTTTLTSPIVSTTRPQTTSFQRYAPMRSAARSQSASGPATSAPTRKHTGDGSMTPARAR